MSTRIYRVCYEIYLTDLLFIYTIVQESVKYCLHLMQPNILPRFNLNNNIIM